MPHPFVHRYFFHFGSLALPTFGVLTAVGLLLALWLSQRTARLAGIDPDKLWDAGIFTVLSAYVLSRLLFAAANLRALLAVPWLVLTVPSLTPAGVALTAAATLLWLRIRRLPELAALDAWAPCATLIWMFVALGHSAVGSDPGLPSGRAFSPAAPGMAVPLHPVALYAAFAAALLTVLGCARLGVSQRRGEVAGATLALAGVMHFLLTLLRPATSPALFDLQPAEWISVAAIALGGTLLAYATPRAP